MRLPAVQRERLTQVFAAQALTLQGWQRDVRVRIEDGVIADITAGAAASGALAVELLLPGMGNVHSHAFQRAMAGLAEVASAGGRDNFWSWREVMYRFALRLTPEQVEAVARYFYIELLQHGYTAVGEFHYLHKDANGAAYADPTELSHRIIAAARGTGIHLTHLPVLYETANVGGLAAQSDQRRFLHAPRNSCACWRRCKSRMGRMRTSRSASRRIRCGRCAPKRWRRCWGRCRGSAWAPARSISMRRSRRRKSPTASPGVGPGRSSGCSRMRASMRAGASSMRRTWTRAETKALASSGAVAGLCPTTEANLGDGIFPGADYIRQGGKFGIGSDSNVCVSPFEELRQLESAQRLSRQQRTVLAGAGESTGRGLYARAAAGGAQALGLRAGAVAPGMRADLAAYDLDHPLLAGKSGDALLDTLVFGLSGVRAREVIVGGRHVVKDGRHEAMQESAEAFREVLRALA